MKSNIAEHDPEPYRFTAGGIEVWSHWWNPMDESAVEGMRAYVSGLVSASVTPIERVEIGEGWPHARSTVVFKASARRMSIRVGKKKNQGSDRACGPSVMI